jgi:hypothetical protein
MSSSGLSFEPPTLAVELGERRLCPAPLAFPAFDPPSLLDTTRLRCVAHQLTGLT